MPYIVQLTYRVESKDLKISEHTETFDFQDYLNFREYETKGFSNLVPSLNKVIPKDCVLIPGSCGSPKFLEKGSGHLVEKFDPSKVHIDAPHTAQAPQR